MTVGNTLGLSHPHEDFSVEFIPLRTFYTDLYWRWCQSNFQNFVSICINSFQRCIFTCHKIQTGNSVHVSSFRGTHHLDSSIPIHSHCHSHILLPHVQVTSCQQLSSRYSPSPTAGRNLIMSLPRRHVLGRRRLQ